MSILSHNNISEKQAIKLADRKINYLLKTSKRARRIHLAVYCDGSLRATRPWGVSRKAVERFIIEKADWLCSKLDYFKYFKKSSLFDSNPANYLKYKNRALDFIRQRISHYNKLYNFKFNRLTIKNQKTRWGSCSRKKNLNFNYRILLLPQRMADYIIVHELCHLKELNHSRRFWDLVGQAVPDYSDIRKEIRKRI